MKDMTLDIILVTKILSDRGTNALGDFEVQYMYDPRGTKPVEKYVFVFGHYFDLSRLLVNILSLIRNSDQLLACLEETPVYQSRQQYQCPV